jgi:hypothetical protein
MSLLGVYPFTVFVANNFRPDPDPKHSVIVNVNHYHHLTYYDKANKRYTIEDIDPESYPQLYSIPCGYRLGFPMYFGDEYLEISLDLENGRAPGDIYNFAVGAKAGCLVTDSKGQSIPPTKPTVLGLKDNEDGVVKYYKGGTWKIDPTNNPYANKWKLKIMKYSFDPEEENVTIGEDED